MFADYQSCVLEDYQKKMAANKLSFLLVQPTPANLKKACIAVYNNKFQKKDERLLQDFFERKVDTDGYERVIRQFDTERFKPLCNFLKQRTNNTDEINIELLAWLIDFQPRPYYTGWTPLAEDEWHNIEVTDKQQYESDAGILGIAGELPSLKPELKENDRRVSLGGQQEDAITAPLKRKRLMLFAGLALSGVIGCLIWVSLTEPQQCMYWMGDHYEAVSCDAKIFNKNILAMDTVKMAHFRRITKPDTITKRAKGYVWYSKIGGTLEYYTSDGVHPLYTDRELKKLTDYMIEKHITGK